VKKGTAAAEDSSPDITNSFDAYLKAATTNSYPTRAIFATWICSARRNFAGHAGTGGGHGEKAKADLMAAEEQLKTLGVDKDTQ